MSDINPGDIIEVKETEQPFEFEAFGKPTTRHYLAVVYATDNPGTAVSCKALTGPAADYLIPLSVSKSDIVAINGVYVDKDA